MEYIPAKHLLHRSRTTEWFGTDHTMNIYRGCCHGCIYCDSRSQCYGVDDFDTVKAKADALRILRDDLARKVRPAFIATGAMSDPYNPFEGELLLTRRALELIDAYDCGVAVATKSDLIVRDGDILQSISRHSPVVCKLTVTTTDDALASRVEPAAPPPSRRLKAIAELAGRGLFTGVLLMPVLPFLEDSEENVCAVAERAAEAGARFVYPGLGVTLRQNQRDYFYRRLEELFPGEGLARRYESAYGARYSCPCPRTGRLWRAFTRRCDELGLLYRMKDIISAATRGYGDRQLSFFN